ncbi:hypothetical protein C1645_823903 [Glomus cerebriforme]|uniref:Uncharacterized protein n=1 Tax=Glomus cerebriforme TaxID=658196 RepID=A0A397SZH6_9GLOM|nr:hypothetical protein C1645_823903 [Glomus cerebriforme]
MLAVHILPVFCSSTLTYIPILTQYSGPPELCFNKVLGNHERINSQAQISFHSYSQSKTESDNDDDDDGDDDELNSSEVYDGWVSS